MLAYWDDIIPDIKSDIIFIITFLFLPEVQILLPIIGLIKVLIK